MLCVYLYRGKYTLYLFVCDQMSDDLCICVCKCLFCLYQNISARPDAHITVTQHCQITSHLQTLMYWCCCPKHRQKSKEQLSRSQGMCAYNGSGSFPADILIF